MGEHAAETKQPEPLISSAKITATISGLLSLLVTVGIIPPTLGDAISHTAEAAIVGVGLVLATVPPLVHAWQARKKVTPVASPKDDAGNELVPAGSTADTDAAAAVALARADEIFPSGD